MTRISTKEDAIAFFGAERVEKELVEVLDDGFDEAMADGWGELWQREDVAEWVEHPERIQKIQPSLADFANLLRVHPKPVRVLDAGCYGGYVYDYLDKRVFERREEFHYTGIDSQEEVVAAASIIHAGCENAVFETADIYRLGERFAADAFDVVFCSRVLVQVPWFERALGSLFAVARHAVFAVIAVRDRSCLERIKRTNLDTGESPTVYFRYFTTRELMEAADALGAEPRIVIGPGPYASYILYRTR